jgi:hypothetical protein
LPTARGQEVRAPRLRELDLLALFEILSVCAAIMPSSFATSCLAARKSRRSRRLSIFCCAHGGAKNVPTMPASPSAPRDEDS